MTAPHTRPPARAWPPDPPKQCPQVDCEVGKPRVNYRETISKRADFDYLHKKQSGVRCARCPRRAVRCHPAPAAAAAAAAPSARGSAECFGSC